MPEYTFKIILDQDSYNSSIEIAEAVTRGTEDDKGYAILDEFSQHCDGITSDAIKETWAKLMAVVGIDV